jgi:hypothetical protein
MKWSGPKQRYEMPRDPGPLTKLFWALQDWWRFLDGVDRATVGLMGLAIALWMIILYAAM